MKVIKLANGAALCAAGALGCQIHLPVQAQSSVTLYGALDAYVARYSASESRQTALNSGFNPNNLGFSAREDLGGGAFSGMVLEMQPVIDTGTLGQGGKAFGRQSFVFLGSELGQVSLGRIHTPGRAFGIKYSATGWLSSDPGGILYIASGTGISPAMNTDTTGARLSNAVSYTTPTRGGFTGTVMHSTGEGQSYASGNAKVTTAAVSYLDGPLMLDLVVGTIYDIPGRQSGQTDIALGGRYDFTVGKVFATVVRRNGSVVAAPGATPPLVGSNDSDMIYAGGVQFPVGPHLYGLGASRMKVAEKHRGFYPANVSVPFATRLDDTTVLSVSYTYFLSKRTSLFVAYGTLKNDTQGNTSFSPGMRPVAGGRSSIAASGIRHSF